MLLGERLIAFRDASGRVGVMDHRCPHRCASLFYGRNEAGGIRCVYHGWQFDADGTCVDMPNLPPDLEFKQKVHAKAYKVTERGIARDGYPVLDLGGKKIGEVTSGSPAPFLKKNIALAYVPLELAVLDTEVAVEVRGNPVKARIIPTPFYRRPKKTT